MRQFIGFFLLAIWSTIPGRANLITVTFTSPEIYGSPGDTLTFGGILLNSGPAVYINGASLDLTAFGPSAYDLTDFLLNAPLTPLEDGDSAGPFDFFTVAIPPGFADGEYDGTLIIQGGATMDDDAVLGSGSFTVGVAQETTATPEPASCLLLGTALVALGMIRRLRGRER